MRQHTTPLALAGVTLALLLGVGAPSLAFAQDGTEETSCDDLKKKIADKKKEKRAAEAAVRSAQRAYDRAVRANEAYARDWEKNSGKARKEQVRKQQRAKRKKLMDAFKAARDALNEAKADLATIDEELAELEARLEDECKETADAYVPDSDEDAASDEVDPWYAWMDWYYEELETFPDCEAELFSYDMYDLETGDLCED